MTYVIIAVVVAAVVALVIVTSTLRRSRSARSDWLGELTEIRRSSLGDDDEVTGVLSVVEVDDDPAEPDDGPSTTPVARDGAGDEGGGTNPDAKATDGDVDRNISVDDGSTGLALQEVTDSPDRTIDDAGTSFDEHLRPADGVLRVESTDVDGLRVFVADSADAARCAVNLPHGALWFRAGTSDADDSCTVRIATGWIIAAGTIFVLAESDWCYVMCLAGTASVLANGGKGRVRLEAGHVTRIPQGDADPQIAVVGVEALESEGVVRRQRRLDATE